jgi:2-oxoglutarate ferredoxin oxidoreductase subunit alpha
LKRKIHGACSSLPRPLLETHEGSKIGIITVGGCDLAAREALDRLLEEGMILDYMRIRAFPFSEEVERFVERLDHSFVVEQNRDGQLRSLLILETGAAKHRLSSILSYGGLPVDADFIADQVRQKLHGRKHHELQI